MGLDGLCQEAQEGSQDSGLRWKKNIRMRLVSYAKLIRGFASKGMYPKDCQTAILRSGGRARLLMHCVRCVIPDRAHGEGWNGSKTHMWYDMV